jgi:hypothetical protein
MSHEDPISEGKGTVWIYSYEIVPPQPEDRLRGVDALLDDHGSRARSRGQTWEGRLVSQEHVTHIFVVSDSARQDLEVNHHVEAALRDLKARFSLTSPMVVVDE